MMNHKTVDSQQKDKKQERYQQRKKMDTEEIT